MGFCSMFKWIFPLLVWFSPTWASAQTILVLGDSISAAYGLPNIDLGWVALLQQRLAGSGGQVVNASIPGDTSAGGLHRIAGLLTETKPSVVIVELGANDGLRGLALDQLQANLSGIINHAQEARAKVMLLGMRLPSNYGKRYTDGFANVFSTVASERRVVYVPFLMDGVGAHADMMQPDGLHPNAAAQPVMLEHVWKALKPLLAGH